MLWTSMAGGPGVFRGDLGFYTGNASLTGRFAPTDPGRTPVHLVVGVRTLTCTPENARRTVRAVAGATLAVRDELGHFPRGEHPEGFRPYFLDALARLPRAEATAA